MRGPKTESTDTADSATITNSHSVNSGFLFSKIIFKIWKIVLINFLKEEESLIDYESSDDEEKESVNGDKDSQIYQNPSQNIPNNRSLSIQDSKNCTMWIGSEDGRSVII